MTSMSFMPRFPVRLTPALPMVDLTDDERDIISRLQVGWDPLKARMEIDEAYYLGEQTLTNLGIALPQELHGLRTVIGWPATAAVDPLEERCTVLGFRLDGATDVDLDLWDIWTANHMDSEQSPLHLDALSLGAGWYTVGNPDSPGDIPLMRIESPLDMVAEWDPRTLRPRNVLQIYWDEGSWHAVLYTPNETVYVVENEKHQWEISDRDRHGLGRPLAVRLVNRPRSRERSGGSEITPAIRNITDAACRALLNLQVAGELYSVPQKYILGATEADFMDSDGTAKTGWQAYMTKMLALERDDEGEVPTVGQFQAYDPATFTKVLDFYASQIAGMTGATPQELGLYTEGNPPSADSVEFADGRRNRKARRKHALFGAGHVEAIQLAVMLMNGGTLPADMRRMTVEWEDPAQLSMSQAADAVTKLLGAGSIPATSDVTLAKAGFTPIERARLAQDRVSDAGEQVLMEIANGAHDNG